MILNINILIVPKLFLTQVILPPPLSLLIFLTQVMLLNACMDVAKALSSLIDSTKDACGKPSDDPTMERLKSSAKEMVQSVR